MASSLHASIASRTVAPVSRSKAIIKSFKQQQLPTSVSSPRGRSRSPTFSTTNRRFAARSASGELNVLPVQSVDSSDQQDRTTAMIIGRDGDGGDLVGQVVGSGGGGGGGEDGGEDLEKLTSRLINAAIVLAAGSFAITKLITIDQDYWHGWTIYEILRYAPEHNWIAYEEALKSHPVLAKMMISGVVYSVGDWIAQSYEGKPLFDFDRARMFRSGLVGFALHGSLSHYYYEFSEALFPFKGWWVVPAKVAFDQTAWAALWNSIYYASVGLLRFESPASIFKEWKATFWPMLTAGWKLWPFAHLITYGVVPLEQRLLWVDSVELIWVTILSTYSNEKSEARNLEASAEASSASPKDPPQE